ncbi:TPA: hypothetical protein QB352_001859 [Pasteurella multocida]|nr:hypothetical protein [Pasteurella multocida]
MNLQYQKIREINFNTVDHLLNETNDTDEICNILLSIGLYYEENGEIEDILYAYFKSEDLDVSRAAILSIGHLVRRKRNINKEKLLNNLKRVTFPIELMGTIEDVIDDFNVFSLDNSKISIEELEPLILKSENIQS